MGNPPALTILPMLYDFILWYTGKLSTYPKKYKYTLGERITNTLLDVLERIIEAQYATQASRKKHHFLRQANLSLEKLRFLIRLSKDLQCLSLQEYEHAARQLNEMGKMVGGWQKYSQNTEETPDG